MTHSLTGRADLLRALAADDPQLVAAMADLLGYEAEPDAALLPLPLARDLDLSPGPDSRTDTAYLPAPVPFWRLESFAAVAPITLPPLLPVNETTPWHGRPMVAPRAPQLAPEQEVFTQLRQVSALRRAGREIDVGAVVERIGRGRLLDRLPYRQQRAWGESICVVKDRSRRLTPYWRDQDDLVISLKRLYPPSGIVLAQVEEDELPPCVPDLREEKEVLLSPAPGAVVLVLGDLGCLATNAESLRERWLQWGRELGAQGVAAVALVPAMKRSIPSDLASVWTILPWGAGADGDSTSTADTLQRLLTLLSPTVRLEPGLLREVRCLLPEGRRDPGLEARVWQDPAIASRHFVAASWQTERRHQLLAQFAAQPEPLRLAVLELIRSWRTGLPPGVWFSEIAGLDLPSRQVAIDPAEWEAAVRYFSELAEKLEQADELSAAAGAWIERASERLTSTIATDPRMQHAVHRLYELIRSRDDTEVPPWYDPVVLSLPELPVRQVELWQAADQLVVQAAGQPPVERGSRLGLLYTANGEVVVSPSVANEMKAHVLGLNRQPRLAIALPKAAGLRVGTDRDCLQFGQTIQPEWASEIGRDEFGLWAAFEFAGVRQCLRWIPPGRFWMGSPEDEEGRWDDEGPRHEVQLTQGFWLFDTLCTQDLWQAVMKKNPSRFKGKERPVEQVSWEDCQQFIARLNDRWPTLALALPSEAEWEYACRAGTTTARYADELDAIAWYEKNSGGETKPVKGRQPNGWGLYDMLGNVDEWCHDGQRDYARPVGPDPLGPTTAGAYRVIRGGSWVWDALVVRSACRGAVSPGYRLDYLGFRCASSSQVSKMAQSGEEKREKDGGGRIKRRVRGGRRQVSGGE